MQRKISKPSLLLFIVLVGFPQISETIYTPSLPDIAHHLGASNNAIQLTLSIYFLGFAFGVYCWGRLSDSIGRRPAMLWGILVYGLGSLGCYLSGFGRMVIGQPVHTGFWCQHGLCRHANDFARDRRRSQTPCGVCPDFGGAGVYSCDRAADWRMGRSIARLPSGFLHAGNIERSRIDLHLDFPARDQSTGRLED